MRSPIVSYSGAAAPKAPSDEGGWIFAQQKDWGREYFLFFSPSVFAYGESTSLIRGRLWCGK